VSDFIIMMDEKVIKFLHVYIGQNNDVFYKILKVTNFLFA
jgi:hypothetical protein